MDDAPAGPTLVGLAELAASVVRVGDGRGFVIAAGDERYIVTSRQWLSTSTWRHPVGKVGGALEIEAEYVFSELVADIAVLGRPEIEDRFDKLTAFDEFVGEVPPFDVAAPPPLARRLGPASRLVRGEVPSFAPLEIAFPGHVLSPDGVWLDVTVRRYESGLLTFKPWSFDWDRMYGSPVITATGAAIGVLTQGSETNGVGEGEASILVDWLPGWLLRKIG